MNQNPEIMNRLELLRKGIMQKDTLGKEYIRKVNEFLQRIRDYLNRLNQDSGAVDRLTKEKDDLTRELEQLRAEHANALKQATDKNAELENSLKACNEELDRLKQTLNDGAAQSEASKQALAAMQQQLDAANRALAESQAALAALQEQLRGIYDTFDEILRLLEAASINRDDIDGLDALIAELNGLLQPGGGPPGGAGSSGRGNGGLPVGRGAGGFPVGQGKQGITRLMGRPGVPSAARNIADRNADVMASRLGASELPLAPSGLIYNPARAAGGEDRNPMIELGDIYKENKDETNPQGRQSASQRTAIRAEPHYMWPKDAKDVLGKGGSRRRLGRRTYRKKTMHRGGYVEKLKAKKTRKRSRTSKRRKSTASSSSSSASSNSRQKSVQGRKM